MQQHQQIAYARQSPTRAFAVGGRKADLNAAVARTGEAITGTSLLESHRPTYNSDLQMPYSSQELLNLIVPEPDAEHEDKDIEKSIISSNSAEEDNTEEAITNALFSVQGNVDEVSVIDKIMQSHQPKFAHLFKDASESSPIEEVK